MSSLFKQCLIVITALAFAGCGGGGGGGGDTTKPVITIVGDNPMDIILGTTFSDPGATATDDTDGDITDKIITVPNVNPNTVGAYSVKYSVKDAAGNQADEKTRVVNVYVPASFQFTSSATPTAEECQANIITVSTKDANGTVIYTITDDDSNSTEINTNTGVLTFKQLNLPDNETKDTYTITVQAKDNVESIIQEITINITQWQTNFHGKDYGCVPSPYTGKVWLDRNIGASQICQDENDTNCFGNYYQWGRSADGHEVVGSEKNDTLALNIPMLNTEDAYGKFIETNESDWVASGIDDDFSKRVAEWNDTRDGSSICPTGYYVASEDDISQELIANDLGIANARIDLNSTEKSGNSDNKLENAYNTFLKLPANGMKDENNTIQGSTVSLNLWTSTIEPASGFTPNAIASECFTSTIEANITTNSLLKLGMAIRCIKQ